MKTITIAIVACVLAGLDVNASAEVKKGDHFVELDAKTAAGKKFRLKDMAGKWVAYTFGASWCQPCHKELVAWDKLAPKFAGKVLFAAVNINNDMTEGKDFITSLKLKHLFVVYMPDEDSPAMKAYDPARMPSTFIIDPTGVVRAVQYGYEKGGEDKLAATLAELIKG
jgi:peroxiredoxin